MSIINEAIKKARKESGVENKYIARDISKEEKPPAVTSKSSEIKWTTALVVSLVLIVSLFGSILLYKHMSRLNTAYPPAMPGTKSKMPVTFGKTGQKTTPPAVKIEDVAELNGIVYGPENKWAIINNKIVREGDSFLDGELTLIARDFVKIEKDNGKEIILNLR